MQKGNLLPDVEIINFEGSSVSSSSEFIGQKTFIYFWSQTQMNYFQNTYKVVNRFKKKSNIFIFFSMAISIPW